MNAFSRRLLSQLLTKRERKRAMPNGGLICLRTFRQGRCIVLLFGYLLGIVLGCAITLTFDFRYAEPVNAVNVKRELIPLANDEPIDNQQQLTNQRHGYLHSTSTSNNNNNNNNNNNHHQVSTSIHYPSPVESHFLYVAVLPVEDIKSSISSLVHTWGQTVSKLAFFVSKDTEIPNFQDPSQKSQVIQMYDTPLGRQASTSQLFQLVQYLYDNHRSQYKWFLLANERVYVNIYTLHEIAGNAGPRDILYTGNTGGIDGTTPPSTYCIGESGVLLSQEALIRLGHKLEECKRWKDIEYLSWDVGLGQCMNISLGLGCFKLFSKHFVMDKLRTSRSPEDLLKPGSPFHKALTVYPVVSSEHMYTLHYYYSSTELKKAINRVNFFNTLVGETCQELPQGILENDVVQNDCSAVVPEDKENDQPSKDVIKQHVPFHRFKPANKFQYQHWQYFDPFYIYTDDTTDPYVSVKAYKYHSLELKRAIQEAVSVVSKRHHPSRMKFKRLHNGYVRHDPLHGNEYIIDATFAQRRKPRKTYNERVRIIRPLSSGFILQSAKNDLTEKVHIVVPISDVTQRCFEFLSMFANVSFTTKEETHLVLVVYGESDLKIIEDKVQQYRQMYSEAEISVVKGEGTFSRSKALDQGMRSLEKSDLAFFCDVDMTMERAFLNRCRRNTVEGKMVYYPEVFKLYNPKFTGSNHNRKISRKQGHWVNYGYGMLCIYKSDYDSVGGLNTNMLGWGGEDVDLFEKVLKSKLEILQSPDTGLIHRWHPNVCSQDTINKSNRESCINSRAEVLGDKSELAKYIYNLMETHPELVS